MIPLGIMTDRREFLLEMALPGGLGFGGGARPQQILTFSDTLIAAIQASLCAFDFALF
jgi:hypothetical protein